MLKLLSIVEDHFEISGRGLVVIPGIPLDGDWTLRIGDKVLLELPNGTSTTTIIRGIEMAGGKRLFVPLLLGAELNKEAVPIGTKIWVDQQVLDNT